MAKEIRIKMDIEGNAVDALKNIQKAYDDINKSAENAKKATEGIAGSPIKPSVGADMNLNPTGKYYKQTQRKDREEMLSMAMAGDTASESFIRLQEKTGQMRDTQDELNARLKYFAQSGFEQTTTALAEGVGVLGATAQVAIGSMELLGISNEEATATVAKLASVEAVMNGVKQISIALQSDSMFMLGLENAKMKALAFTTTAYSAVVGTSTGALKAFRLALAGTGIGLAVVAIGALANAWSNANDEAEKLAETEQKNRDDRKTASDEALIGYKQQLDAQKRLRVEALRGQGRNKEADALEQSFFDTEMKSLLKKRSEQEKDVRILQKRFDDEKQVLDARLQYFKDNKEKFDKIGGEGYTEQYQKQTELMKQNHLKTTKEMNEYMNILNFTTSQINTIGYQSTINQSKNTQAKISKQKPETVQASAPKNFTLNIAELGRIDQVNIMSEEDEKAFQQRLVNAIMGAMTTAQARVAR